MLSMDKKWPSMLLMDQQWPRCQRHPSALEKCATLQYVSYTRYIGTKIDLLFTQRFKNQHMQILKLNQNLIIISS